MGKIKRGNCRHESYTVERRIKEVLHDLRYDKTIHMTNDKKLKFRNVILHKLGNQFFEYGHEGNNKFIDKIKENILNEITEIREEHKTLFKKYNKRTLREKRNNSINRGILTFENQRFKNKSDKDKEKFIKDAHERIKKFCELKKIKLLYVVYHDDEESGHFHYMTSNFYEEDNKLKTLNIKKNKGMGKELQDFYYENFTKKHGYERGLSKELTNGKHQKLGTDERERIYEEVKREVSVEIETLKNQLKEENEKVKNKMDIINNSLEDNKSLRNQNSTLIKNIENLENDKKQLESDKKKKIVERNFLDWKLNFLINRYQEIRTRISKIKYNEDNIKKELHKFNKMIKDRIIIDKIVEKNKDENKHNLLQTEKKEIKYQTPLTWEEFIEKESKLLKNIVKYEEYKPYQQKLQIDLSYEWKR